jgi:predicted ATPase
VRIGLLGGLRIEHEGEPIAVSGSMQLAVLFRLAVDAGTAVSYRSIAEDVWGSDAPENGRAALQSIVSRLRSQLPPGIIESTVGGYRLAVARADVDALHFSDLVARGAAAGSRELASQAMAVWTGEPWIPSDNFDWFERDLRADRATALALGGDAALPQTRNAIPTPLTALVGRENELAAVAAQLAASRLVTVVGPGGAGKTRLALAAAAAHSGAILVELAPVGSDEVLSAVLAATGRELRTAEASAEPVGARQRVLDALVGRDVLLVLDNCEHVIDAAARAADDLLSALPSLRILATSREPLGVPGEAFVSLGSLAHPSEAELSAVTDGDLERYPAIELFLQRATAASGAPVEPADLPAVARICARLDGLPLALELAAARLRTMSVAEVLAGLDDRFTLLTGGFRTALPRHQTLRAMIDWSWSLLTADEQRALARLAVFPAGIDVADARRLTAAIGLPAASVFDSLVDKSLLARSRGRYRALETIREFGIERLAERGELAEARRDQARYLAERAAETDRLLRGPGIYDAIAWFDSEDDNIAAALRYTSSTGMAEEAVALCTACGWYWTIRDRQDDTRLWFATVIPLAEGLESDGARLVRALAPVAAAFSGGGNADDFDPQLDAPEVIAQMLDSIGPPATGDDNDLLQVLPVLLSAFAAVGADPRWMADVRIPRGEDLGLGTWPCALLHVIAAAIAQNRGDVEALGVESEIAVASFTAIGDLWGLALAEQMRSEWLTLHGRLDEALATATSSTDHMRPITTEWDLAQQMSLSVSLLLRMGRVDDARDRTAAILAAAESGGNARTILQALMMSATVDLHAGDTDAAAAALERIDGLAGSWPRMPGQLVAMVGVSRAEVETRQGDTDAAAHTLRAAADAALATHDHPVIAGVALGFGVLAVARGEIPEALRALDLATAIVGIHDATSPQVIAIERAARAHGIERAAASAPTRSSALESLAQLTS